MVGRRLPADRDTENSDDVVQPLPAHVVAALRSWLALKPLGRSLWPPERNTALMVRTDLKAAGIAPEAFDFHCLRHSYVSAIVQCGGSVKDSMELARHHDADLTFNRYATPGWKISPPSWTGCPHSGTILPTLFPQTVSRRDSMGPHQRP